MCNLYIFVKLYKNRMDYATIANVVRDQASQILSAQNISGQIKDEVSAQISEMVEKLVEQHFIEIKENIRILNQQVLILKEAIESIDQKHSE